MKLEAGTGWALPRPTALVTATLLSPCIFAGPWAPPPPHNLSGAVHSATTDPSLSAVAICAARQ